MADEIFKLKQALYKGLMSWIRICPIMGDNVEAKNRRFAASSTSDANDRGGPTLCLSGCRVPAHFTIIGLQAHITATDSRN